MATVTLQVPACRPARWRFAGYDVPALDPVHDPQVPTVRGALLIPTTEYIDARGTRVGADADDIEAFYRGQGLTANDLLKMTARDALDRVPVSTIRARSAAPSVDPADPATSKRGTLAPVTFARALDNTAVPNEPTPIP